MLLTLRLFTIKFLCISSLLLFAVVKGTVAQAVENILPKGLTPDELMNAFTNYFRIQRFLFETSVRKETIELIIYHPRKVRFGPAIPSRNTMA
jgi:hypothetical protein